MKHQKLIDRITEIAEADDWSVSVNEHLHTPETFYFQVCDIEESLIGRYIFRNGKARKIA